MRHLLMTLLCMMTYGFISSQAYTYSLYAYDNGNYRAGSMQQTIDGNLLIVANADCFTPGAFTIEGCPYSPDMIKTSLSGEVIWKENIPQIQWGHNPVFENSDGSFSWMTSTRDIFHCEMVFWSLTGSSRMIGFRFDEEAALQSMLSFNDECHRFPRFAVSAGNDEIIYLNDYENAWQGYEETSITRCDKDFSPVWNVLVPVGEFTYSGLVTNAEGIFLTLRTWETDSLYLMALDAGGNPTGTFPIGKFPGTRIKTIPTQNSDILITVGNFDSDNNDERSVTLLRVATDGEIKWQRRFTGSTQSAILETATGYTIVAMPFENPMTLSTDVLLRVMTSNGDSISHRIYDIDGGDEVPVELLETTSEELLILGDRNCCNYEAPTGPGHVFVIRDTTIRFISPVIEVDDADVMLYPNPTRDEFRLSSATGMFSGSIQLINILGQVVDDRVINTDESIGISHLPSGVYTVCTVIDRKRIPLGKLIKN